MKPLRILIAEDDPIVAADLEESIQEIGHEVVAVARDGDQAARMAGDGDFELAVLDIRMPGSLDGVDLARQFRRDLDIPVIFVTAFTDDVTQERARRAGPWAYLVKPFDHRELRMSISLAIQHNERELLLREAVRAVDWSGRRGEEPGGGADGRYRALFRDHPSPICLVTLDDERVLEVNDAFEETFGWERTEVMGVELDSLSFWVHADDRARIMDAVRAMDGVDAYRTALRNEAGEGLEVDVSASSVVSGDRSAVLLVCADVTERATTERELERMALYDPLTNLPNRNLFHDRLSHALDRARREGREVGILFIDLDGFKVVNDTFGHAAGDEVLRIAGRRIAAAIRGEDTVARIGGDEFTVILEDDPTQRGAELAARRIHHAFSVAFEVDGRRIPLSASIGISVRRAADTTVEDLVSASDRAMYWAKRSGGGQSRVEELSDPSRGTQWKEVRSDLLAALEQEQFVLLYEPMVRLRNRRIDGAAAHLRWRHPDGGMLMPSAFLPLAREEGLGPVVYERVLNMACAELRFWRARVDRLLVLTLDLEIQDLISPDFDPLVETLLGRADLPPGSLRIQLTTEELMRYESRIRQLRASGLGVVLHRFGLGSIPVGFLRDGNPGVDQVMFDSGLASRYRESREAADYLSGLIGLSHGLDLRVVARGLSEEGHVRELRSMGADHGQGPALGEPMEMKDFRRELTI